jgi:hypothetical protein
MSKGVANSDALILARNQGITKPPRRETIYTTTIDLILAYTAGVLVLLGTVTAADLPQLPLQQLLTLLPAWLAFELGTEDMKSAYRQCPVLPEHLRFTVVAFWHFEVAAVRFIILFGSPSGLSSVVLNFNRAQALQTSFLRRCCGVMSSYFFDDTWVFLTSKLLRALFSPPHVHASTQQGMSWTPANLRAWHHSVCIWVSLLMWGGQLLKVTFTLISSQASEKIFQTLAIVSWIHNVFLQAWQLSFEVNMVGVPQQFTVDWPWRPITLGADTIL